MKNKSIRFKLYALSTFLLLLSVIIGGVGMWSSDKTSENYSKVSDWNLPNTRLVFQILMQSRQARLYAFQLSIPGLPAEKGQKMIGDIENALKKYDEEKAAYLKFPFGPGEEELWKKLEEPLEGLKADVLKVVELYKKNPAENSPEQKEIARLITVDMNDKNTKARPAGAALIEYHDKSAEANTAAATAAAKKGSWLSIVTLVAGAALGIVFSVFFTNGLTNSLTEISNSIAQASSQVGSGSMQIASASEELSQATTEQAASLEQTAASIEEMNSMIAKNTDNAKKSATNARTSQENAIEGRAAVEQMIRSMDEINQANNNIAEQINHSNTQISEIVKVINEIGEKTKVINDIVFQTKLLSFNASVEAARAGEHGKGFAVVAEEVGNLAQMSGKAAQEITAMLDDSVKKVESIVNETKTSVGKLTEEGKRKVEFGTQIAQQCGQAIEQIVSNIESVSSMAEEISSASQEQAQGIGEITKAMNSLDQVTQQNSSTSEESASAAEELSGQAESLKALVQDLVYIINGHSGEIEFKHAPVAKAKVTTTHKNNVVPIKQTAKATKPAAAPAQKVTAMVEKKASGDKYPAPSYDDARFNDV